MTAGKVMTWFHEMPDRQLKVSSMRDVTVWASAGDSSRQLFRFASAVLVGRTDSEHVLRTLRQPRDLQVIAT